MKLEKRVTSDRVTRPLFQGAEGGSSPTVTLIDCADARRMVETWHYTKRLPTGRNIYFGWWAGDDLYAVAVYGNGVNPYQANFLRATLGWVFGDAELLELRRCVRVEPPRDGMPMTRFLALCHRWLAGEGYRVVVAFSDPEAGHEGTLYRAGNWTDVGMTSPEWHLVDADGNKRHRRFAFRHARRNGIELAEARDALGCTRIKTAPKHRFALRIGGAR